MEFPQSPIGEQIFYLGVNLQFHTLVLETSAFNQLSQPTAQHVKTHLLRRVGAAKDFYSDKEVVIKPTLPSSCVLLLLRSDAYHGVFVKVCVSQLYLAGCITSLLALIIGRVLKIVKKLLCIISSIPLLVKEHIFYAKIVLTTPTNFAKIKAT